jgi:hypothetical protein
MLGQPTLTDGTEIDGLRWFTAKKMKDSQDGNADRRE